jgi:hypothetical protein
MRGKAVCVYVYYINKQDQAHNLYRCYISQPIPTVCIGCVPLMIYVAVYIQAMRRLLKFLFSSHIL